MQIWSNSISKKRGTPTKPVLTQSPWKAGTWGWSDLISWHHHWSFVSDGQVMCPVAPCIMIQVLRLLRRPTHTHNISNNPQRAAIFRFASGNKFPKIHPHDESHTSESIYSPYTAYIVRIYWVYPLQNSSNRGVKQLGYQKSSHRQDSEVCQNNLL